MAITLESNTQSKEEMTEAMVAAGHTPKQPEPVADKTEVEESKPAVEEVKESEKPGEPGDKVPAETGDKTAADTEPAKTKPQETQESQEKPAVEEKPKVKGGYQVKLEKGTREVARLREELEAERGDKTALRQQLEEAKAALAKLQPKEPEKPAELVKPSRPKKTDPAFQADGYFDEDKYEAALEAHEEKIAEYFGAVTERKTTEAVAAKEEERKQETAKAERDRQESAFLDRRDKGKAAYDDYDEMWQAIPEGAKTLIDVSPVTLQYITSKSKDPAHLIYFLAKDFVENDGAEGERLAALDDFDLAFELKAIEQRLIEERKAATAGVPDKKETPVVAETAKQPEKTPAKEVSRSKTVDAPIEPVGSRASGKTDSLEAMAERKDTSAFIKEIERRRVEKLRALHPAGRV